MLVTGLKERSSLQLYNAYGQLIKQIQVNTTNLLKIDMSKQAAGIYIIKTTDENGTSKSYKVVKE